MNLDARIYIAGHTGLVGGAIYRLLKKRGYTHLITRTHGELDLLDALAVRCFFEEERPEYVFLAAAFVGGIGANNRYRADFIYNNLGIQQNVIGESYRYGVKKLLFLGSTCIYPREAPQPIKEEYLLTDSLEYTNEPYAIAKIAGLKMCESFNIQHGCNYIAIMPTNLYGRGDNFDLENSHVLPAIMRKIYLAHLLYKKDIESLQKDLNNRPVSGFCKGKSYSIEDFEKILSLFGIGPNKVVLWGTGKPLRDFMWSEDLAEASLFIMDKISFQDLIPKNSSGIIRNTHINVATGVEYSIRDIAQIIANTIGFTGIIQFDSIHPDGTLRKLVDTTRINNFGWSYKTSLQEGIPQLYKWYRETTT
ncbi:GDP-L-fucose synthase family protein [Porphyromonas circumdentaria]|uniref:GDP-L-fucose synthase n=1 Tax=Porphyromonas circumdentaria TaxID=29524 RepID=A0A1T4LD29_9PORP|nr:GDP-L-fucose synthase [Porphyromonas circumdentaria]MBB6275305.1 GDP-L-fucose synthase [Porphyromonas circumdentaria]MDO4722016.1 GDP-L-fucose synthase [Porphyromonas circumdentaria]SJZ52649.1 GDP-L-fucose synthase [Porphyromonas circumdentaria]